MPLLIFLTAVLALGTSSLSAQTFTEQDIANRHQVPVPASRLLQDWMYQDYGLNTEACFKNDSSFDLEKKMIEKVLAELKENDIDIKAFQQKIAELEKGKTPGNHSDWKDLYLTVCNVRRLERLRVFEDYPREYIFVKHFVFGDCQAMFAMSDHLTDAIFREVGRDY